MKKTSSAVEKDSDWKTSEQLITLTFSRGSERTPSNVSECKEQWNNVLKAKYGSAGGFLKTGTYYERPEPEEPDLTGLDPTSLKYETRKAQFLSLHKNWLKKVEEDVDIRVNIYARMWAACSEEAKAEIQKNGEYDKFDLHANDPLALWELIIKHCSVAARRGDPMAAAVAAERNFSILRQDNVIALAPFHREFNARVAIMKSQGCDEISEEKLAFLFTDKLDNARYWQLKDYLRTGMLAREKTVIGAYEQASDHPVKKPTSSIGIKDHSAFKAEASPKKAIVTKEAPVVENNRIDKLSVSDASELCYECGKPGHRGKECTDPLTVWRKETKAARFGSKKPKDRNHQAAHVTVNEDMSPSAPPLEEEYEEEFSCAMVEAMEGAFVTKEAKAQQVKAMHKYEMGFDTMCSSHIVGNAKLLRDVKKCKPVNYRGIGGRITVKKKGTHSVFGDVYLHPGVPNLLSVGQLTSEESIASGVEVRLVKNAFEVSKGSAKYTFRNGGRRLFVADLSSELREETGMVVETVAENERLLTKKQIAGAKRARLFSLSMGCLSMANLVAMVRNRRTEGIDLSFEDVILAYETYGPELQAIRGKTVKQKTSVAPEPAVGKIVDADVTMHIDLMYLSGVAFLISYVKPLCLLLCNWVRGRSATHVKTALNHQIATLQGQGFKVVRLTSDSEGAVCVIKEELQASGVDVEIHDPNTDSAEVDVKIKQLKNVTRAITVLPYVLPLALLMYAVMFACARINMLPNSSLAHNYSPMEVFLGRSVSVIETWELGRGAGRCHLARDARSSRGLPTPWLIAPDQPSAKERRTTSTAGAYSSPWTLRRWSPENSGGHC